MILLNSCVYSLFPIYTEETLVFIPELIGKWQLNGETKDFIQFSRFPEKENLGINDGSTKGSPTPTDVYTDSVSFDDAIIRFNSADGIMVDGKMVYDSDSIRMFYEKIVRGEDTETDSLTLNLGKSVGNVGQALKAMGKSLDALGKTKDGVADLGGKVTSFEGSMYESYNESYVIRVMDNGQMSEYIGHVAKIGTDHFLDIYPLAEYSDGGFGSNMMPVHTFLKLNFKDDQLELTPFDLEKLNRLFDSNLIRLRHENVDGTVLITAQPEEIQKFIDRYSDDESVFEDADIYQKIN